MSGLGVVFGAMAGAAGARGLAWMREDRPAAVGLADLLNWGFLVDDGVVLQKDGSLLAGWKYHGPDLAAATPAEVDALSRRVNDAFLPFADDWMFHVDAIRRPAAAYVATRFPDPVTQLMDDERRRNYEVEVSRQFETTYTLIATHLPPPDAFSELARFFVQGASGGAVAWSEILHGFEKGLRVLEDRVMALNPERLGGEALLAHLHECMSGERQRVAEPPRGAYLNVVLADRELVGGFEPRIGQLAVRPIAVHGYPRASEGGQCDFLNSLPFAFRWSTRILPLGTRSAAKHIRRHQLQWFRKRKGAGAWVQDLIGGKRAPDRDDALWLDQDARQMAEDASVAASENASSTVRFCFHTQVMLVLDQDPARADAVAGEILKVLNDAGLTGRIETVNALEAYLGSLPGHGYPNLRRPLVSSRNIADLLPVTSVWPGLATNPSPLFPVASPPLLWAASQGATPFRLNLHDSDVGHTLVLGKTGAGKSVLLGMLAAQFRRYPGAQVFAFDVGYSLWALARAAGTQHYDLAAGRSDSVRLQPLAATDTPLERAWSAEWLETLLALQGVTLTPALRGRLDRALELVSQNDRSHRTLTELAVHLQHPALAEGLRPYTVTGSYRELLDAGTDDLEDGAFQVFELKHLMALDDRIAIPVLLYLFRHVERRLDGRPTLITIDEAWMALMHSLFGARVNQWLLQLRKQNAAVVLATQSPAQVAALANRHTILDSCATKIYLPNAEGLTPGQASLYRELGLNDREIAIIAQATPKRHYYFKSPRGCRLFDLALGPVALSFLAPLRGLSMEDTRRHIEELITAHGSTWPAALLAERGLGEWAARFQAYAPHVGGSVDD